MRLEFAITYYNSQENYTNAAIKMSDKQLLRCFFLQDRPGNKSELKVTMQRLIVDEPH
jgi:hypothetical protein